MLVTMQICSFWKLVESPLTVVENCVGADTTIVVFSKRSIVRILASVYIGYLLLATNDKKTELCHSKFSKCISSEVIGKL